MTNYIRAFYYLRSMLGRVYWKRDKLREYQNKKLRETVRHAYESSPFYHRKLVEAGVKPEEVRTVEDLNKLPIIRKDELIGNLPDVISREFEATNLKTLRTSGSTGRPLYVYVTQAENEFRKAKHLRANIICGQRARDKWVTITSPLHFAETTGLQRFLGYYAITPISVFDDVADQLFKIEKLKPDVLDGYSNSILLLAKETQRRKLSAIKPRFLVTGAELIDSTSRSFIERVFDAPVYDQYACVELERMAWQCPEREGYHIDADSLLMQFVDEKGEEVSPGEQGEIVCTSFFNRAMPFIRYALDDVGTSWEQDSCACGRTFPIMRVVKGRKNSIIKLPGGKVVAPIAFMLAVWTFKYYGCIDLFRVVQERKDRLRFKLKLKDCEVSESTLEEELRTHLAKVLNLSAPETVLDVECVDDIPLDKSGKFRIVVSELDQRVT